MKTLRLALLSLLGFSALFISCTKEKSFEVPGGGNVTAEWEFTENKDYKGSVDTAYIDDFGTPIKSLIVEGPSADGKELFSLQVIGINTTAGATYRTPQVLFRYINATSAIYTSDITAANDFTVVITKIDSVSVSGTFTGKVKDSAGASKTITNGKFSSRINNSSNPGPVLNGQLTFWAKSSCSAGGNITIQLNNNQTGAISTFTANEPNCGATGTASFSVPPGVYNWKAKCGSTDSTAGVVTVQSSQCVKIEIAFAAPINCRIADFALYDFATNTPLASIRSTYNASNVVNNIKFVDSFNAEIVADWNVTYPAGRVQLDANTYFLVDANSRITEYHGRVDPSDTADDFIITKYTYDAAGYMSGYTSAFADSPTVTIWKGVVQWSNGNMVKITEDDPTDPTTKYETTYEYHSTAVKNFIYTFPLAEITFFQTAVNAGKNSQNALKKETFKTIVSGNTTETLTNDYDMYVVDPTPNQYVKSFRLHTQGDSYSTKVVLSYHCF